jgi:broad specificity phosphatase PhoE
MSRLGRRLLPPVLLSLCLLAGGRLSGATEDALRLLVQPGHVLLLRHANAPGVGDPPGMRIGDCATQRNLDERGRAQARKLGGRLRAAGINGAGVFTSQWCRCRETARLLAIGRVEDLPALNSFFEQPEAKVARIQMLRKFLDHLPRDGRPVVLVTHQMTITALTGDFPSSGEGMVLRLRPGGGFDRVAELAGED